MLAFAGEDAIIVVVPLLLGEWEEIVATGCTCRILLLLVPLPLLWSPPPLPLLLLNKITLSATAEDSPVVAMVAVVVLYIDDAPVLAAVRVEDFELKGEAEEAGEEVSAEKACGMETWDATRVAVEASSSSLRVDTPIGVKALFSLFFNLLERGYVGRRGITVGEQLSSLFTCDEETGAGGRVRAVRGEGLSTYPLGCWPMVMGVVAVDVAVGTARCSGESQPWLVVVVVVL